MSRTRTPTGDLPAGYRPIALLADGRRLETWDAWDEARGTRCVVKLLRADRRDDPRVRQAVLLEGHLATSLAHPHLVRGYDVLDDPPTVVLETLRGATLSALVEDEPLGLADVAELGLPAGVGARLPPRPRLAAPRPQARQRRRGPRQGRAHRPQPRRAARRGSPRRGDARLPRSRAGTRRGLSAATDVWGLGMTLVEALTRSAPYGDEATWDSRRRWPLAAPPRPGGARRGWTGCPSPCAGCWARASASTRPRARCWPRSGRPSSRCAHQRPRWTTSSRRSRRAGEPFAPVSGSRCPTVIAPTGAWSAGMPKASRKASRCSPGMPKKQAPEALVDGRLEHQQRGHAGVDVPVGHRPAVLVAVGPALVGRGVAVEVGVLAGERDDHHGRGAHPVEPGVVGVGVGAGRLPEQRDVLGGVEHEERPPLGEAGVGRPLRVGEHPVDDGRVDRLVGVAADHPATTYDLAELHGRRLSLLGAVSDPRRLAGVVR